MISCYSLQIKNSKCSGFLDSVFDSQSDLDNCTSSEFEEFSTYCIKEAVIESLKQIVVVIGQIEVDTQWKCGWMEDNVPLEHFDNINKNLLPKCT